MKLQITRIVVALSITLTTSLIFSPNAFAARPQSSGCTGLDCYGAGNGGYGNHLSGTSGTGNLAGYSMVRFDGYRPNPTLDPCNDNRGNTVRVLASLGLSGSTAQRYVHRRVAILRSDNTTATNGVPGALYWDSGLDFNLRNGSVRPSTNLNRAPTQGDPWIGPHWLGNEVCLPLAGGVDIKNELSNKEPVISILYKGEVVSSIGELPAIPADVTEDNFAQVMRQSMGRVAMRMKGFTLRIVIEESSATNAGITIDFEHVKDQININVGSLQKFFEFIDSGSDPEKGREIWVSAKNKKAPIFADFDKADVTKTVSGTTTTYTYDVPLRVRKKGIFSVNVDANYNAYVGGNNGTTLPFTGLSGTSNGLWLNAVSIKSVNRKS